jgi:tetratricopeptide (TPR) repeat protein
VKRVGRSAAAEQDPPLSANWFSQRVWLLALLVAALVYALLAGLRKVSDFDLFWQLASGRWVAQHHAVFSTDVFSYTASGQPWIYPVGSGLIFYGAFLIGGYSLISWLGAMACAGSIALLVRRASPVTAVLAIVAVPDIAIRTTPRADMFTIVLFAAFLSVLWERYECGASKLWLLPLLMVAWVNLHLGFLSGLVLSSLFVAAEAIRLLRGQASRENRSHLKLLALWLAATFTATLVNPWGWNIYSALSRQEAAMPVHSARIGEWATVTLGWGTFKQGLEFRNPASASEWLLVAAFLALLVAVFRRKWLAALLLVSSCWLALQHVRFVAELATVVVVVGGAVLTAELKNARRRFRNPRLNKELGGILAVVFLLLACLRSADLVTNRYYFGPDQITTFGGGLSWWFPDRAMAFVEREKLPTQIFNSFEEGGFLLWKLGPMYTDYIDGRTIPFGPEALDRLRQLQLSGPDSPLLLQTADFYGIHTVVFALARNDGLERVSGILPQYCISHNWRPVYLDEASAVFVRRMPQTQALIDRFPVDCATAQIPLAGETGSRAEEFNRWANAASLLLALNRSQDALNASNQALSVFSDSAALLDVRGRALLLTGHPQQAEHDLLQSAALDDHAATWSQLAAIYHAQHRYFETIHALEHLATLQTHPEETLLNLGYANIEARQPMEALRAFDRADSAEPAGNANSASAANDGRAMAWEIYGNLAEATKFEEKAVALAPQVPALWSRLAHLYQIQGREQDALKANERAAALGASLAR